MCLHVKDLTQKVFLAWVCTGTPTWRCVATFRFLSPLLNLILTLSLQLPCWILLILREANLFSICRSILSRYTSLFFRFFICPQLRNVYAGQTNGWLKFMKYSLYVYKNVKTAIFQSLFVFWVPSYSNLTTRFRKLWDMAGLVKPASWLLPTGICMLLNMQSCMHHQEWRGWMSHKLSMFIQLYTATSHLIGSYQIYLMHKATLWGDPSVWSSLSSIRIWALLKY